MNIFMVDHDPIVAAQALCDKHVVKMILETRQILDTVLQLWGNQCDWFYRPTHISHPCVKWAAESFDNFCWLFTHGLSLCEEYTYRYGKIHKCEQGYRLIVEGVIPQQNAPSHFFLSTNITPTKLIPCMKQEYIIQDDIVASYRNYYNLDKSRFAKWTRRAPPLWYTPQTKTTPPPPSTSQR